MKSLKFIFIIFLFSCEFSHTIITNDPREYTIVPLSERENDFATEKVEPNYTDNLIYNDCLEITYEYKYFKNDTVKYFEETSPREWQFIDEIAVNNSIGVKRIRVTAENPSNDYDSPPQSAVNYEVLNSEYSVIGNETTGVIENYKNILIHNPRTGFFQALFSFPWPSVKFPIKDNPEWNWQWGYNAEFYGDDRIFNWEGITKMIYHYKYLGEETIELNFGKIETSKFEATGSNGKIANKLIYHFNSKIGFVKQTFLTYNGARIELYAVDYKNRCESDRN